jgi:peptidoglycan/xylan/chitin deacetylase (PgdA/CDA1 family)
MRIRGVGRVRAIAGKIRNRVSPGGAILLYHRVASLSTDPQLLCVTPEHFAEHLQVIRQVGSPGSLSSMAQSVRDRRVMQHSIAITFDDGAADNLHEAKPLLERYDCPATVFVATAYVDSGREFWWDELERIFLQPGALPENLEIAVNGTSIVETLGAAAQYDEREFENNRAWNVLIEKVPGPRQHLYQSLYDLLRPLPSDYRYQAVAQLQDWAGADKTRRPSHQTLTSSELRQLAAGGLVAIGAHTVNHPVLSGIPEAVQQDEIRKSKLRLEEILDQPVDSFAYPYGQRSDYSLETVKIVRDEGFSDACSNFKGVIQPGVDLFQLPRFVVQDWNGDEFEQRLKEWFRG